MHTPDPWLRAGSLVASRWTSRSYSDLQQREIFAKQIVMRIKQTLHQRFKSRGLQRDVVYLGWPIAPSYMSPNAGEGGGGGVAESQPMSTAVQINFGDLTSIFNLCYLCLRVSRTKWRLVNEQWTLIQVRSMKSCYLWIAWQEGLMHVQEQFLIQILKYQRKNCMLTIKN